MALNIDNTRQLLQKFDFQTLFREELGWNNPTNKSAVSFQTKEGQFYRRAIAELSGAIVFEITNEEGIIPDGKVRQLISNEIQKINFEHILIFVDKERTQSIWRWIKKQDKKSFPREHHFFAGQTGDLFISKLSGLMVDMSEIENDIKITDVAKKIQNALDIERVTRKFYKDYQEQFIVFVDLMEGIDNEADKRWYASVILNRLMFIYFLQEKGFINNNDRDYLYDRLKRTKKEFGKNKYYSIFLKKLFFEGFAKPEKDRSKETNALMGTVKYLNGGLFLEHKIEEKYPGIAIPDDAFENLLKSDEPKGLFERFSWSLDDTPGGKDDEINPDVLGYIFEKYINQKAFGAYYTRTEITEYLCEQTVYKLILDAINESDVDPELLKKAGIDVKHKPRRYDTVSEMLLHLDAATCRKLVVNDTAILPNLSLLDPACGSGAFLVAAMKTLINVYSAVLGRIDFVGDKKLKEWKKAIEQEHPSINYYIKKKIITNNLYGVDIMEEATEIAKLRLFLALVSSAHTVEQLEPLPNIDFNIMNGNSLIGLLRVDANQFNKRYEPASTKPRNSKVVQKETLFQPPISQVNLFGGEYAANKYQELINEKEAAIRAYKNANNLGVKDLQDLRDSIQEKEANACEILNQLLLEEFTTLGIKYEQVTWDGQKNKEGKPVKRNVNIKDIQKLEPFHWGYEFSEIFRKKNGFDAIITNPPWEIFKPDAKEFFIEYSDVVTKKKMTIKDFEKEQNKLLKDDDIKTAWLEFQSKYPYVSLYFRSARQFKNQISIVNGKKAGTDINLYKLFTEQCYNLLKKNGYCGIVIPSGIYTDLGTKQLREMLFEQTKVTGLFCFENRKEIFEAVHRSFKFVVVSFEKDGITKSFPAAFMRHDVQELINFPKYGASEISIDFIKKQSPESFSIPEIKNEIEFSIAEKMLKFPVLGDELPNNWNIKLSREIDPSANKNVVIAKYLVGYSPIITGEMINQFSFGIGSPKYWIKENEARKIILGRSKDNGEKLDYEDYRLGFRKIARNTNSRTLIATIIPPCLVQESLQFISGYETKSNPPTNTDLFLITSLFKSFTIDYQIRQSVSSNINFFFVYNLPLPRLHPTDKWYNPIVERAAKLICTTEEFAELWEDVMKTKWIEESGVKSEVERNKLRAELDGIIAHIYGLTEEELAYILSTFPIVPQVQKDAVLQEYKRLVPLFRVNNDGIKWQDMISKGESPRVEFKSTLRVDVKTGQPEKFIEHSVLKTIAGFLNSDGGTLLIGVEDDKNILGLEQDFNSFKKPDKLDEFQKHFDNIFSNSIGDSFHHYLEVEFPEIDGKQICAVTIKEKSSEPVYMKGDSGAEALGRVASLILMALASLCPARVGCVRDGTRGVVGYKGTIPMG